jgi:hypothetical protein
VIKKSLILLSTLATISQANIYTNVTENSWNLLGVGPTESAIDVDKLSTYGDMIWVFKDGRWVGSASGDLNSIDIGYGFWIKTNSGVTQIDTTISSEAIEESTTTSTIVSNPNSYDFDGKLLYLDDGSEPVGYFFTKDGYVIEYEETGHTIICTYTLDNNTLTITTILDNDNTTLILPNTLQSGQNVTITDSDGESFTLAISSFDTTEEHVDSSSGFNYYYTGSALYDSIKCKDDGMSNFVSYMDETSTARCIDANNDNKLTNMDNYADATGQGVWHDNAVRFVNYHDGTLIYYILNSDGTSSTRYDYYIK